MSHEIVIENLQRKVDELARINTNLTNIASEERRLREEAERKTARCEDALLAAEDTVSSIRIATGVRDGSIVDVIHEMIRQCREVDAHRALVGEQLVRAESANADLRHYTSNFCDVIAGAGSACFGSRCTLPKGHDGAHVYGCLHPALDTHDAMLGGYAAIREEEKAKRMACVAKLEKAAFLLSVCSCYELGAIRDEVRQAVVEIIALIGRKENK